MHSLLFDTRAESTKSIPKPYLASLGLSKSLTALVWIAAPLCGVVVQPLMGTWSDRNRLQWGRRRPFILGGMIGVVLSVVALAWVEDVTGGSTRAIDFDRQSMVTLNPVLSVAIVLIYTLNVSIQPLQAGLRTLIVENCPKHQQVQASAWAGCMTGVGNLIGYIAGFTDLPKFLRLEHWTQFQCLCVVASMSLIITTTMSCSVIERPPRHSQMEQLHCSGIVKVTSDLVVTYRHMPPRIRQVCHIQFCAWMAWFPFLFYSTTYVGEFYAGGVKTSRILPVSVQDRNQSLPAKSGNNNGLCQEAIRFGTFASFLFAMTAFLASLLFPQLSRAFATADIRKIKPTSPHIPQLWMYAHVFFALAMFSTFFATSAAAATLIIASVGLSWAMTLWAPFSIIGSELATLQSHCDTIDSTSGEELVPSLSDVQAGAVMGLHNVAISAPQIVAALICSTIFGLAKVAGNDDGTGWVLRMGGLAALGAAYLTSRFE